MSVKEHLESRHLDMLLHRVWIDEEDQVVTFPLWNLSGQMVGYQAYRPGAPKDKRRDSRGRYYPVVGDRVVLNRNKTLVMWGLESWYLGPVLFVTEGIFDACRLTELGESAIALLGNSPSVDLNNWLWCVQQTRPVVSVCDPDLPGKKLAKVGHISLTVSVPGEPEADLGDGPEEHVRSLIKEAYEKIDTYKRGTTA